MAARNLVPCVMIRRAESTGEDPIYTCATDEDTASRPAPRWERSTAPPTRWPRRRPGGAGVSSCGPSARSGRGRKSGGGRTGEFTWARGADWRSGDWKATWAAVRKYLSPPAGPWSMRAGPHARKPPGGHAPRPLHVPHGPARPATSPLLGPERRRSRILCPNSEEPRAASTRLTNPERTSRSRRRLRGRGHDSA